MAERPTRPESGHFSPGNFGARVFALKEDQTSLDDYLMDHLDPTNERGRENLEAVKAHFEPLTLAIRDGSKGSEAVEALVREIYLWNSHADGATAPSPMHRLRLQENWNELASILQLNASSMISGPVTDALDDLFMAVKFDEETYDALYGIEPEVEPPQPPPPPREEDIIDAEFEVVEPEPYTPPPLQIEMDPPAPEEPEPEPEPGLPEFSKQVSEVMKASPPDRASRMTQLLSEWPADRVNELFSSLDSEGNADTLKTLREERDEGRQKALLAIAGFDIDTKPSGRDYFIQVKYLLSLLSEAQADLALDLSRVALMTCLRASFNIVAPKTPADDAETTAMLKNPSFLSDVQFKRVFRATDEIPEGLDETSVNANDLAVKVKKAMTVEILRRPREMKKVLGELSLDQLKVALGPLLATTMENADFHRSQTPGDPLVQKAILGLSGFSTAPAARGMFERLGQLKEILDSISEPSGADTPVGIYKRAIELALMHIAPADILAKLQVEVPEEAAPDPSDVISWGARFRARAKKAVNDIKDTTVGNAVQTQLLNNSIRRTNDVSQYNDFFGIPDTSTRPTPPSPPAPQRPGGADPAPDSEREEEAPRAGLLARASDGVDRIAGRKVPLWMKKAGLALVVVAGTEWVVRSAGTAVKTTWGLGTKAARTGLNVVAAPFSRMLVDGVKMWNKGWSAIEPAEPPSISDSTPWYQKMGDKAWYGARQLGKGVTMATVATVLGLGGAAYGGVKGTGEMVLEGAGIRYEPSLNVGVTVQEVTAAIKGKVGEEALQEIAAMTNLPEAIQKAIAELGEGGLEILEKAGVIADSKAKSFGDRFHVVENSGFIAIAKTLAGGAKEAIVDNTVESVKLKGARRVAEGAVGAVVGHFTIPSITEMVQLAATLERQTPKLLDAYGKAREVKDADGNSPGKVQAWLNATGSLSKADLSELLGTVITTFDLDEKRSDGKGGVRAAAWSVVPTIANIAADWYHPERNFTCNFGKGLGPELAQMSVAQLTAFVNHEEALDKIQEEHATLAMSEFAELKTRIETYKAVGAQHIRAAMMKFLGARALTSATAPIYLARIEGAIEKLESVKDGDKVHPIAGLLINAYKNTKGLLEDKELMKFIAKAGSSA